MSHHTASSHSTAGLPRADTFVSVWRFAGNRSSIGWTKTDLIRSNMSEDTWNVSWKDSKVFVESIFCFFIFLVIFKLNMLLISHLITQTSIFAINIIFSMFLSLSCFFFVDLFSYSITTLNNNNHILTSFQRNIIHLSSLILQYIINYLVVRFYQSFTVPVMSTPTSSSKILSSLFQTYFWTKTI